MMKLGKMIGTMTAKQEACLKVIEQVYEQHLYIRPIVRGKAATPVEFGTKLDLSIDENRLELGKPEKSAMADKEQNIPTMHARCDSCA